jgi:hypothetical protein
MKQTKSVGALERSSERADMGHPSLYPERSRRLAGVENLGRLKDNRILFQGGHNAKSRGND